MNTRKTGTLTVLLFLLSLSVLGQTNPPPMAMPKDSNVILVDRIIEVTKHKEYFIDYCTKKVKSYAQENNWSTDKTNEILESIKFKDYNSTIYNSYAFYTKEQLNKLLDALTLLNSGKKTNFMVLTNSMMQSNLDLFVNSIIKGDYVTKK